MATRAAAAAAASRDFVSREVEARAPGLQAAALLRLAEVQSLLRECHLGTLPVWRTAAVQCLAVEGEIKRMLLSAFAKVRAEDAGRMAHGRRWRTWAVCFWGGGTCLPRCGVLPRSVCEARSLRAGM